MTASDGVGGAKRTLLAKIESDLDDQAASVIVDIVDAVCEEAVAEVYDHAGLITPKFAENILRRLQVHHATAGEKFKKTPFEYAFERANRAEGREVSDTAAGNTTASSWDVKVGDKRFSLKTEAERSLSTAGAKRTGKSGTAIKVSKLMEMRDIRDLVTPEQVVEKGLTAVLKHLGEYDRMLTLRGYDVNVPFKGVRYDLYEFPLDALREHIGQVSAEEVERTKSRKKSKDGEGPLGSWKVHVVDGEGEPLCDLVFDASVEKVTLRGLPVARCDLLAHWVIKSKVEDDEDA